MTNKHRKTLRNIFHNPVLSSIPLREIENMLLSLDAFIAEAEGSRISIELNGVVAVFHRPHPKKETDKGALMSVRKFLKNAGINHDEI